MCIFSECPSTNKRFLLYVATCTIFFLHCYFCYLYRINCVVYIFWIFLSLMQCVGRNYYSINNIKKLNKNYSFRFVENVMALKLKEPMMSVLRSTFYWNTGRKTRHFRVWIKKLPIYLEKDQKWLSNSTKGISYLIFARGSQMSTINDIICMFCTVGIVSPNNIIRVSYSSNTVPNSYNLQHLYTWVSMVLHTL